jgi:aerobic-type carbon monoxide dehydrogenase small subunit (CoxS/CutS family)
LSLKKEVDAVLTPDTPLMDIVIHVNGKERRLTVAPDRSLLEVLRDDLGLTGAKKGCDDANCGACTVLLDGRAVKSCCMLAAQADGARVTTIEGLENGEELHPMQQAFIDYFAVQCGFCTPGRILTAIAVLGENPRADEDDIREGLHGNVCRCTGYTKIIEAVRAVQRGEYAKGDIHAVS